MSKKPKENKEEPKDFLFPTELVQQVYEISGGAESYKGVILCVCSQQGTPQIYTRFDSVVTSLGMKAAVSDWLLNQEQDITTEDND